MAGPHPASLTPGEPCTFCRLIADGSALVYHDDLVAAFLDRRPLFPGHLLITPVQHVVTLDQLPCDQLVPLFGLVQRAVTAMTTVLGADGAFMANNNIISQSVPHLHVHVVPRRRGDGLRGFFWPRTDYDDPAHRQQVFEALAEALA